MATKQVKLEGADRRYGWKFGGENSDEFVNATEAADILGISVNHMCRLLGELEGTPVKKPTDRTWPLRAGKPETAVGKNTPWMICLRSVREYAKRRQPVEV